MANKSISELTEAIAVNNQDLFVLEQGGLAKKMTAETFITAQNLIDALAEALDGHGGIQTVALTNISGRVRTYTMIFSDGSATTFQVYDGSSIERITKTSSAGLVDTYTVFLTDGTTTYFTVSNGADGDVSEATLNNALKYKAPAIPETTASSAIANFTDGADDMVMHNIVAEIDPVQDLTYGDPYPAGGGKNKLNITLPITLSVASNIGNTPCVLQAGTYTFTSKTSAAAAYSFTVFNSQGTQIAIANTSGASADNSSVTFTITEESAYIRCYYNAACTITNMQIESGSSFSSYAPYSNICPITGHTAVNVTRAGKNIADKNIFDINEPSWSTAPYWIGLSKNADGTYTLTRPIGWGGHGFVYIGTYPAGTYTVSFDLKSTASVTCGSIIRAYNTETWVLNAQKDKSGMTTTGRQTLPTITTTDICDFWLAVGPYTDNNSQVISGDYQVEVGSTSSAYEAYTSATVNVSWQNEAGTVYGGTIDVATGLLTVNAMLEVFDQVDSSGILSQLNYFFTTSGISTVGDYTRLSFGARGDVTQSNYNRVSSSYAYKKCNMLKHYFSYADESAHWYRNTVLYAFFPSALVGTTASSVISYLTSIKDTNPLSFWIPLTTPQTYQLTAQQVKTLYGTNNVWADTGDVAVTYPADTKMYIDNAIATAIA